MPLFQNRFVTSFAEQVALALLSQDRQKTKLYQGTYRQDAHDVILYWAGLSPSSEPASIISWVDTHMPLHRATNTP